MRWDLNEEEGPGGNEFLPCRKLFETEGFESAGAERRAVKYPVGRAKFQD